MIPRPLLVLLALLVGGPVQADPAAAFAEANRLFESGDHAAAATAYEALARDGHLSAGLLYNLGTTKHRLGETGEGALWMRRALVLEPGMPEATQSLAYLRSRFAWFEFADTRLDRFLAGLPPTFGRWAVALSLWAGALAIAASFSLPRLRPNRPALLTLGFVLLMVAFVASRAARYRAERLAFENFATVIQDGTNALTAPVPEAKAVIALPPGSELRLLQSTGPWSYVEIPGNLRGWVRSETVAPVWPLPVTP